MAHYFQVGSDDINLSDAYVISQKAKELDLSHELITKQAEQIKVLREALSGIYFSGVEYINSDDIEDEEDRATVEDNFNHQLIKCSKIIETTKD